MSKINNIFVINKIIMAAPILKYCITESDDAKSFDLLEATGENPATSTGWNGANFDIADSTASSVTVSQLINADTAEYTTAVVVPSYPTLPNITGTLFNVTAEDCGYGTDATFPDGVYKIIYSVTNTEGSILPVTTYRGFTAQLDCCIKKLADKVAICSCNCDGLEDTLREIYLWRRLLSAAQCCGNVGAVVKMIEKITRICNSCKCSC